MITPQLNTGCYYYLLKNNCSQTAKKLKPVRNENSVLLFVCSPPFVLWCCDGLSSFLHMHAEGSSMLQSCGSGMLPWCGRQSSAMKWVSQDGVTLLRTNSLSVLSINGRWWKTMPCLNISSHERIGDCLWQCRCSFQFLISCFFVAIFVATSIIMRKGQHAYTFSVIIVFLWVNTSELIWEIKVVMLMLNHKQRI